METIRLIARTPSQIVDVWEFDRNGRNDYSVRRMKRILASFTDGDVIETYRKRSCDADFRLTQTSRLCRAA